MEGHEIQLLGGQYVIVGFVIKHKRNPGKTHKASLLSECLDPDTDFRPLLRLRIGLEVSACTGNAQRVALWDALRLSQASDEAGNDRCCKHHIADLRCIQSCWTRCRSNNATDSLIDNTSKENMLQHHEPVSTLNNNQEAKLSDKDVKRIIVRAIMKLQHTGVDPEGNLQAYWAFLDTPMNQRINPTRFNKWLDIVADTRDTSTFAVVSQRCLQFRQGDIRRRQGVFPEGKLDPPQKTFLLLQLLPRPVMERERGLRRRHLDLSTPSPQCCLVELSPRFSVSCGRAAALCEEGVARSAEADCRLYQFEVRSQCDMEWDSGVPRAG